MEFYLIASTLDPHMKQFDWTGAPSNMKAKAWEIAKREYLSSWASDEERNPSTNDTVAPNQPAPPNPVHIPQTVMGKRRAVSMSSFMGEGQSLCPG